MDNPRNTDKMIKMVAIDLLFLMSMENISRKEYVRSHQLMKKGRGVPRTRRVPSILYISSLSAKNSIKEFRDVIIPPVIKAWMIIFFSPLDFLS